MTTTTTAADFYFEAMTADFTGNEWQAIYEAELLEAEYNAWEKEEAAKAVVVVPMFTDTKPAQPAAAVAVESPYLAELVKNQDAVQFGLSQLNTMMLNAGFPALRNQIKEMAFGMIDRCGLMEETNANYRQMIEAAAASAAYYFNGTATEAAPVHKNTVTPYKRKYTNAADISRHLSTASSLKEVSSLYYVNAELIELTPALKQAFTDKKAWLYRPSNAAA